MTPAVAALASAADVPGVPAAPGAPGVAGGVPLPVVPWSVGVNSDAGPLPSAANPAIAPSPIVSTAVLGTTIMAPRSLSPSYSMFIARRCKATGLLTYDFAASWNDSAI